MGTGELNVGGKLCDGLVSHRRGSRNLRSRFSLRGNRDKLRPDGMEHLTRIQTLPSR